MSHAELMTPENQKPKADKSKRQSALAPAGLLGANVVKNHVGKFEYEAEFVGGSLDGWQCGMVRSKPPAIGHKTSNNGCGYRLLKFKNGVAMYHYVCPL